MPTLKPTKKTVLETSPHTQARIQRIAKDNNSTLKSTTAAILEWAIPRFEDGRCKIEPIKVSEKK